MSKLLNKEDENEFIFLDGSGQDCVFDVMGVILP